ncbi:DUF2381 family protein [Pyxidicoccus fallax]|uniref:DUF2381 family protein n=1 Tax=Pyxidicoccus fallax TaxID=394095 RepID=A0A848LI58_9BACT|nr:DUF2381 family protein [Pyxidicoccus fallax]NMO17401.1 DUF2381 family protein [Pyxidicoccus fallax]NPC77900.1 DUF2381 family protein [Pyxidicoccus fallax]
MQPIRPNRATLLLLLLASAASAHERESLAVRSILLSEHPDNSTHRVYVKGQVATVLRFEKPVAQDKTRLLGWEGRFEPLVVADRRVLLEPLHDLASEEGVPLLVTLVDGTEVPFLLRPPDRDAAAWTDQQVNVFEDRESYEAIHSALIRALKDNQTLEEENERLRQEETSPDHALAALLVSGAATQTPFVVKRRWFFKDVDADVEVRVFSGKTKAAVVFNITNRDSKQSWRLSRTRSWNTASGQPRGVAVKTARPSIPPGESGSVAVVADRSAFMDKEGPGQLALELFRHDGQMQVQVVLDPRLARE